MAAHMVNPRQLLNSVRSDPRLNALSERAVQGSSTFVSDPGTTPHGGSWDAHYDTFGPSYMRARKLAAQPTYDEISYHGGKSEMREEKRWLVENSSDTTADLEARGIRDPVKVGIKDPYDYLRGAGHHTMADAPMQLMNGNHRVTWALDNHPDMWVPMRPMDRTTVKKLGPRARLEATKHGEGPSFQ